MQNLVQPKFSVEVAVPVDGAVVAILLLDGIQLDKPPRDAGKLTAEFDFGWAPILSQSLGINNCIRLAQGIIQVVSQTSPLLSFATDMLHGEVLVLREMRQCGVREAGFPFWD